MLRETLIADINNGVYDSEYMDYIMENCAGDRMIGNGDMLIEASEDMYLYDEFIETMCAKVGV